ncbi:hypothetical protein GH714_041543 [Hevea brasiliensis]|uniref:Uncharacterized protein n=1 Tax=Hevea brasiliensis TaxID=3981 RepID=A0A6A6MQN6_HEVBR|nr:hypothetical protein GH714_041543 [Hevea brasiliensis]
MEEEVEVDQGLAIIEVSGESKVIDPEVVPPEWVEIKACEPHAEAIDIFSKGFNIDPYSVVVEEELKSPIHNADQEDIDLDSSEDGSYQIGSQERESIEDDSSDEDLRGSVDMGFENVKGQNNRYAGKIAGDEDIWGSFDPENEDLSDYDSTKEDIEQPNRRRSKSTYYDLECQIPDLDIGNGDKVTIVTDIQKGFIPTIEKELPKVEHRRCGRHIYQV